MSEAPQPPPRDQTETKWGQWPENAGPFLKQWCQSGRKACFRQRGGATPQQSKRGWHDLRREVLRSHQDQSGLFRVDPAGSWMGMGTCSGSPGASDDARALRGGGASSVAKFWSKNAMGRRWNGQHWCARRFDWPPAPRAGRESATTRWDARGSRARGTGTAWSGSAGRHDEGRGERVMAATMAMAMDRARRNEPVGQPQVSRRSRARSARARALGLSPAKCLGSDKA